jgi:hypothetical protein
MAKIKIATIPEEVDLALPKNRPDSSRIGVNYADAFGRQLNTTLPDGRSLNYKRRGLQLTLILADRNASAIMDRLAGKDDPITILNLTLQKIARELGYDYIYDNRTVYFNQIE